MDKGFWRNNRYRVILFDLDGTLTGSRQTVEPVIAELFVALLRKYKVGIVSGCSLTRMDEQLLSRLPEQNTEQNRSNLYLFPSTASCGYCFGGNGELVLIYELLLTEDDKAHIIDVLLTVCQADIDYRFGEVIEDRGGQVALALIGLDAPLHLKLLFDPDNRKRMALKRKLDKLLPDYEVIIGGTTTISVTRSGVDKSSCLAVFTDSGVKQDEILYIGDAVYAGGNDYPIASAGTPCVGVSSPTETTNIIRSLLTKC